MPRKAQSTPEQEEKKEAVNAPADENRSRKRVQRLLQRVLYLQR